MALDALTIATQGLLSTSIQIAAQGLLDVVVPPTPGGGGIGGGNGGAGGNMLGRGKYLRPPTRHGGTLRMPWDKGKKPSREVIHNPAVDDDDEDAIWLLLLDDP